MARVVTAGPRQALALAGAAVLVWAGLALSQLAAQYTVWLSGAKLCNRFLMSVACASASKNSTIRGGSGLRRRTSPTVS